MIEQYLFLDIDGVLNTIRYSNYLIDNDEDDTDEDGALFDPEAVEKLAHIIKTIPDVKIIISSTWRFRLFPIISPNFTGTALPIIRPMTPWFICVPFGKN